MRSKRAHVTMRGKRFPILRLPATSGVSSSQKLPGLTYTQAVLAIEHTHMLVVIAAAATFAEPDKLRQTFDDLIALALEQFLRADDVGIFGPQHLRDRIASSVPFVCSIAVGQQPNIECHDTQRLGQSWQRDEQPGSEAQNNQPASGVSI